MQKLNQCSTLSKMWLSYVLNMCAILLLWTTWIPIINWVCWAQTLSEGNHGPQKDKRAQKVHEYVKKKMDNWEAQVAPCMEKITWGWHPMFHIFNIVSFLWTILLKFPWTHNKTKVSTIVTSIYNMQKVIVYDQLLGLQLSWRCSCLPKGFECQLVTLSKEGLNKTS